MRVNRVMASVVFATAFVAGTALVSNSASASPIYDNMAASSNSADNAFPFGPLYDSFTTGGSSFNLNQIDYLVRGNPSDGGTYNLSVYSDNFTTPGGVILNIGNIPDAILSATLNTVSTSFAPFTLTANTRYWIGISSADSINWSWSFDVSGPGVANEFFANGSGVHPNRDGPYQMALFETPLPAALPLFATGLGVMGLLARRRMRKNGAVLAAA
jgi:hypothetical protein